MRLTPRGGYFSALNTAQSSGFNASSVWFSRHDLWKKTWKHSLCPVRALHAYLDRNQSFSPFRATVHLLQGAKRGYPLQSRQIVEAIHLAYAIQRADCSIGFMPTPLGVWLGLVLDMSITGHLPRNRMVFARFYNLEIPSFAPHVLSCAMGEGWAVIGRLKDLVATPLHR